MKNVKKSLGYLGLLNIVLSLIVWFLSLAIKMFELPVNTSYVAGFVYLIGNAAWFFDYRDKLKREKKKQKQTKDEEQAKNNEATTRVNQKVEQFESLIQKEKLSIEEYRTLVSIQYNFRSYVRSVSLVPFAMNFHFADLVEVCTLKRQLVWFDHHLSDVLFPINILAGMSTSDAELQPVHDWFVSFERKLEEYSKYKGYSALQKKLKEYIDLYDLAHPKEVEVQ